ncbi:MAG: hypothetical protein HC872_06895, partial [Gammaproteobacteria bacterium]|nr:hypothetical protein [Gammaproteobacteria bacterium]
MTALRDLAVAAALLLLANAAFAAKTCPLAIQGDDLMKFNVTELKVAADCTEVELTLKHVGKLPVQSMGHNWVLTVRPTSWRWPTRPSARTGEELRPGMPT